MEYRNILVQVDLSTGAKARVAAAVELAKLHSAELTGVFLRSEFLATFGARDALAFMSPEDITRLLAQQAAAVSAVAERARALIEPVAREAGVGLNWCEIDGDSNDPLIDAARRHDLTILPRACKVCISNRAIPVGDIGMASGSPVLVLPEGGYDLHLGRRVLIAWKGSRESARALNDAWPFLSRATEIHLLTVGDTHEDPLLDPMLSRQFSLHGCCTPLMTIDHDNDASASQILRRHIGLTGADLVVMGLYGHARLREMVLGGVSHDLLNAPPTPILVSH